MPKKNWVVESKREAQWDAIEYENNCNKFKEDLLT